MPLAGSRSRISRQSYSQPPTRALCRGALLGCALALASLPAEAQEGRKATDQKIFAEVRDHNQIMQNLEHLSDRIGPRLTGSPNLQKAVDWAGELARRYNLENVHVEAWKIAHSWQRGTAEARIVDPVSRNLTVASAGWSPSTPGRVRAKVVYVSAKTKGELETYPEKLKGAIVVLAPPADLNWQTNPPPEPQNAPIQTPAPPEPYEKLSPEEQFDAERTAFFKEQGVAAILRDSDKAYGLLNMGDAGDNYQPAAVPVAKLSHEDYGLVWRLLQKGPVELDLTLNNSFSPGPVEVYNTVAEIRGSEKPDEVVILCAHLDSWDLASGTTDDGTGVVSVLEAARALKASGLRPKRTVRIVLFVGEEQGLFGSRAYVKQHAAEMAKISAVLADDTGAGRLSSIRLNQNFAAHKAVDTALAPMEELNLVEPGMERFYGSDYASFNEVGVPGFACTGTQTDYFRTHHSQADTFDRVQGDGLIQAAQVLAGWAYNIAQLPGLVPRDH